MEQTNGIHSSSNGETTLTLLIHPDGTSAMTGHSMRTMWRFGETRFTQKMASLSSSWNLVMVAKLPIHVVASLVTRHLSKRQLVEVPMARVELLVIRPLVEVPTIQLLVEQQTIRLLVEQLTTFQQEVTQAILHLQVKIQPALAMTYKLRSLS